MSYKGKLETELTDSSPNNLLVFLVCFPSVELTLATQKLALLGICY